MFGQANVIVPPWETTRTISTYFAKVDNLMDAIIEQLSAVKNQTCLDYVSDLVCLYGFGACPGSAWCGVHSRDELKSAVTSACGRCNRDDSCAFDLWGYPNNADQVLYRVIEISLTNYSVGSSTTGTVGDNNLVCQDVTGKRHNLHACSLHCVAVELVMFIYCVVVVYLTFSLISHLHCLVTQIYLGPHAHDVLPCSIYAIAVRSAGNMKASLMSIALVAILFSTGLWLL